MKLVYGIGVNDADYKVTPVINGKQTVCPFYRKWRDLLYRVTHPEKFKTYRGCKICDEWLIFSNFKQWMLSQKWEDMELDKDCLIPNNKIYSPESCIFIPSWLNCFITEGLNSRGEYPLGVYFNKDKRKFISQCGIKNKQTYLGQFNTPEDAHEAWRLCKISQVLEMKVELDSLHPKLFQSLLSRYEERLYK